MSDDYLLWVVASDRILPAVRTSQGVIVSAVFRSRERAEAYMRLVPNESNVRLTIRPVRVVELTEPEDNHALRCDGEYGDIETVGSAAKH